MHDQHRAGDTPEAIDSMRNNRIDLALTLEPRNEDQFEFHPLFYDELSFIIGPTHPWAQRGHVERSEIPRQSYILYNKNSYTFRMVEDYFREEEMSLNTVIELGSMEATKELVKLGLGVSILAPWIAQKELLENRLVTLPRSAKRKLKRTWGSPTGRTPADLAEETFVELCRSVTDGISNLSQKQIA